MLFACISREFAFFGAFDSIRVHHSEARSSERAFFLWLLRSFREMPYSMESRTLSCCFGWGQAVWFLLFLGRCMENLLKVILLAVIPGVTEFLPVSSSGHLVLSKHFLGREASTGASLEIVLHAGTLISILVFYRKHLNDVICGVFKGDRESILFETPKITECFTFELFIHARIKLFKSS